MNERHELKNLIVTAEDTKGFYIELAHKVQDPIAKELYSNLGEAMKKQLEELYHHQEHLDELGR